jgi:dynamin 1-like protein
LRPSITPSDKERFESELIQSLLVSYFNIVRKNVLDAVPKAVMHFLVIKSKTDVQNDLVARLYKEELLEELLAESTETASRRKACQQMLDVLLRANAILADVRDQTRY